MMQSLSATRDPVTHGKVCFFQYSENLLTLVDVTHGEFHKHSCLCLFGFSVLFLLGSIFGLFVVFFVRNT